jgi:hypothetical protein
MLTLVGFWWWQHKIAKGLHENCIVAEVIGSRKTILIARTQICPSDPIIPFKLCRRRFPFEIAFPMTANAAQGQTLERVGIYLFLLLPFALQPFVGFVFLNQVIQSLHIQRQFFPIFHTHHLHILTGI